MLLLRPAQERDLVPAFEVFYANEIHDELDPPSFPDGIPGTLAHILRTGTVYVAEEDGRILAFAAAITRSGVTFLTDLFVLLKQQSSRLGQRLLQCVLPPSPDEIRCTMGSIDPRALALYIRAGMRPQWPNFCLRLDEAVSGIVPNADLETIEAAANDPALVEWDAEVGGRQRPQDHAYWLYEQQGVPLWFKRGSKIVGYGYVRLGAGTLWSPDACTLGPIGARTPEESTACVLAAVRWAQQRAKTLLVNVPGPHPCLTALLEARFRITYVEMFLSSATSPFFDPRCSIASGSDLF